MKNEWSVWGRDSQLALEDVNDMVESSDVWAGSRGLSISAGARAVRAFTRHHRKRKILEVSGATAFRHHTQFNTLKQCAIPAWHIKSWFWSLSKQQSRGSQRGGRRYSRWNFVVKFPSPNAILPEELQFDKSSGLLRHQIRQSLQPRRPIKPYTKACNLRRRWVSSFLSFIPFFLPAFLPSLSQMPRNRRGIKSNQREILYLVPRRGAHTIIVYVCQFHLTFNFKSKVSSDVFKNKNKCQSTSTSTFFLRITPQYHMPSNWCAFFSVQVWYVKRQKFAKTLSTYTAYNLQGDRCRLIKYVLTRLGSHMEKSTWWFEEFYVDPRMTQKRTCCSQQVDLMNEPNSNIIVVDIDMPNVNIAFICSNIVWNVGKWAWKYSIA